MLNMYKYHKISNATKIEIIDFEIKMHYKRKTDIVKENSQITAESAENIKISNKSPIFENTIAYILDICFAKPTIAFSWFPKSNLRFEFS